MGKLILKEMSELLQRDFPITNGAMLTIHQVRATGDLGIARLYISVFPDAKGQETIDFLMESKGEIRHLLARRIRQQVRHIPELQFYLDDTLVEVEKMGNLLASVLTEEREEDEDSETADSESGDAATADSESGDAATADSESPDPENS